MKKMPLVTVIIPVYNVEQYLSECLKSIVKQTYANLEILVIDDGSSDNSRDIIKQFQDSDERVKYIYKENGGLGAARNTGIDESNGEYVCFIDSDDWVRKDYVELMISRIHEDRSDMAICNMEYVYPDGTEKKRTPCIDRNQCISYVEALRREFIGKQYRFHAPNKFFNLSLFENSLIRFPEGQLYEDVATTYKLILNAKRVSLINEKMYYYRQNRPGSIMYSKTNSKRFTDMFGVLEDIRNNELIATLNVTREMQCLYLSNIISLVNYVYPMKEKNTIGDYKALKNMVSEHLTRERVSGMLKNDTLSTVEKIRCVLIYRTFDVYCLFMRIVDRLRV